MSFFKKAMGFFVEIEEDPQKTEQSSSSDVPPADFTSRPVTTTYANNLSKDELDKFERHFDKLFDETNLPGPDYYEFMKMMDTLEAHIPDEKARFGATYASLTIQGLTKDKLLNTANAYLQVVEKDKAAFEKAAAAKAGQEIQTRQSLMKELELKIASNSEMIQKLTKEITDAQARITTLKKEVIDEEAKITNSKGGYNVACQAMLTKITSDIEKIKTIL